MRVPKLMRLNAGATNQGCESEALEALAKGYPVQILNSTLDSVPGDLLAEVSKWRTWSLGGKNPSRAIGKNTWRPAGLDGQPRAGEFGEILNSLSAKATRLVGDTFDLSVDSMTPDRVSWRPRELATISRRWNARDDLFHVDSFASRPTQGRRILRLFFNASPTDSLVWTHSGHLMDYLNTRWLTRSPQTGGKSSNQAEAASAYDRWLGEVHDQMKKDEEFQEKASRVLTRFEPGAVWVAFTDCCVHALLRGEWLMDVTWFISDSRFTNSTWAPKSWFESRVPGLHLPAERPIKAAA